MWTSVLPTRWRRVVLGSLLGLRPRGGPRVGLAYVDGHADFATPEESRTGSAASMCLALAVGRGDTPLARLSAEGPLVRAEDRAEDTVLIGRRDHAEPWYGHDALKAAPLLDLPDEAVRERGLDGTARTTLDRLSPLEGGFWIHVDVDVLDPVDLPAVDSPEPGGRRLSELRDLLRPLVHHPRARGMELTIYDPQLDPRRAGAVRLTTLLEEVLAAPSSRKLLRTSAERPPTGRIPPERSSYAGSERAEARALGPCPDAVRRAANLRSPCRS